MKTLLKYYTDIKSLAGLFFLSSIIAWISWLTILPRNIIRYWLFGSTGPSSYDIITFVTCEGISLPFIVYICISATVISSMIYGIYRALKDSDHPTIGRIRSCRTDRFGSVGITFFISIILAPTIIYFTVPAETFQPDTIKDVIMSCAICVFILFETVDYFVKKITTQRT